MNALHPDDLPDYEGERERREIDLRSQEHADTALTDWLGGRQGRLDEVEEEEINEC
jgi:hypothetical protein